MHRNDAIERLCADWHSAGIRPGDTLLVHSSIRRTLQRLRDWSAEASPSLVLDSFRAAIGPQGTLLLPLFNFAFCSGTPFDINASPSAMGALTEAGRNLPGAVRTGHPVYSFAVIGHHAPLFDGLVNRSGYGADSPFALLRRLDGRIAILDLADNDAMTFSHHAEEMIGVPYRYPKTFTGAYTDRDGRIETRSFDIYVRDLAQGIVTDVDPAGEVLWERGLYTGCRPGEGHGLRTIACQKLFEVYADVIRSGRANGLLYRVEPVV